MFIINNKDFTVPVIVYQIAYMIIFAGVLLYAKSRSSISVQSLFGFKPAISGTLIVIPLFIAGVSIVLSEGENILREYLNYSFTDSNSQLSSKTAGGFLTLCLIAPVLEEVLFRGILLKSFLRRYNIGFTIFLSSLVFGMAYTEPSQMIGAFFFGIFLSWITIKSGSVITAIWAHICANFLSFVLSLNILPYIKGFSELPQGKETAILHQPVIFTIAGFLLLGLSLWYLIYRNSRKDT
jgi:membrane protease YdiL (CAAX protease family)